MSLRCHVAWIESALTLISVTSVAGTPAAFSPAEHREMHRRVERQPDLLALEVLHRRDLRVVADGQALAVGDVLLDVHHRHLHALREADDHRRASDVADVHAVAGDGGDHLRTAADRGEVGLHVGAERFREAAGRLAHRLRIGRSEMAEHRGRLLREDAARGDERAARERGHAHVRHQLQRVASRDGGRHDGSPGRWLDRCEGGGNPRARRHRTRTMPACGLARKPLAPQRP